KTAISVFRNTAQAVRHSFTALPPNKKRARQLHSHRTRHARRTRRAVSYTQLLTVSASGVVGRPNSSDRSRRVVTRSPLAVDVSSAATKAAVPASRPKPFRAATCSSVLTLRYVTGRSSALLKA